MNIELFHTTFIFKRNKFPIPVPFCRNYKPGAYLTMHDFVLSNVLFEEIVLSIHIDRIDFCFQKFAALALKLILSEEGWRNSEWRSHWNCSACPIILKHLDFGLSRKYCNKHEYQFTNTGLKKTRMTNILVQMI